MRFYSDGPKLPDQLLERCDEGRVVFLCGAGVSLASGMPDFVGLTKHVVDFFDPPEDSEIARAFQPWLQEPNGINMPLDQIFNLLHIEYGRDEVNALVTERLQNPTDQKHVGHQHELIKRISSSPGGKPQIVTTNFDLLFEQEGRLDSYIPPTFPDPAHGTSVEGITYLHGRLVEVSDDNHPYVLSSADFGRAYLSEAWATNFIRSLLKRYTVVLVGYQAEDPPIKYLLQGLSSDDHHDRSGLYAFDKGRPEDIETKWRDRGVTALAYVDHEQFWQTMEAWADRADDPRKWRGDTLLKARENPKKLAAHERGQVTHILRSAAGAKLFSEADPPANPEWICVLDADTRSGVASIGYGEDAEEIDRGAIYGLDDDRRNISAEERRRGNHNDHLLWWRHGDDIPTGSHNLTGRLPGTRANLPPRLSHLNNWITKNISSPVVAWWAIRQHGLHPSLISDFERQLDRTADRPENARKIWNLIIEYHRDQRNHEYDGSWYDLERRIANEGWNNSVVRDFGRTCQPRLEITPPRGICAVIPPEKDWPEISMDDLGQFDLVDLDTNDSELLVTDSILPKVFAILEQALVASSSLLDDIGKTYFQTPTCYPERDIDGDDHFPDAAKLVGLFIDLFNRMVEIAPEVARGHSLTWSADDRFFFRKLKLFALSKQELFNAQEVFELLNALSQSAFWDQDVNRELLYLLVDRWEEFGDEQKYQIVARILEGPGKESHWTDAEHQDLRNKFAAKYARYIELQGCEFAKEQSEQLGQMISNIENWNDGWATSTVFEHGVTVRSIGTDENPDVVLDLPVNEVLARAKDDFERDFDSFTEKRPFTGLVKTNPRKALAALTSASRKSDYPQEFWSALINNMPDDISPRLQRTFLHRLTRLPYSAIVELSNAICRWLEKKLSDILAFDEQLGWSVYDHVVNGVLSGGVDAAESGVGEIRQGGNIVERSRRTYNHAINGPLGMCAEALFRAVPGEEQDEGSLIPDYIKSRVERLLASPNEGSDHAVAITCSKLNWLMHVDPLWTKDRLIPMLAFEHPAAEPAWNGFLHSVYCPSPPLVELIKPLLLELMPWVDRQEWDRGPSRVASQWLGLLCIFRRNEANGLTNREMRKILRSLSEQTRVQFIYWLGRVGRQNDNGWHKLVSPFLKYVWPRERRYRTASSIKAWIGLLDDTGDEFPTVYAAVKPLLVPVEMETRPFYGFTCELDEKEPLTVRFPVETLDLLNTVTPEVLERRPIEIPKVLSIIGETAPELQSDHRYLRLIDLVERS